MSEKTKSERFLECIEDYVYAQEQLRFAEGLIAHEIVVDISEELLRKFETMEATARANLLELLDELFDDMA